MIPAHQGFEPDNAAGFDVTLRLVMQGETAAFDGSHKFSTENYAVARKLVERLVMNANAIAAGILCPVKREVRLHEHSVRSVQLLDITRNPDAGRDARGVSFKHRRLIERRDNFLCQRLAGAFRTGI